MQKKDEILMFSVCVVFQLVAALWFEVQYRVKTEKSLNLTFRGEKQKERKREKRERERERKREGERREAWQTARGKEHKCDLLWRWPKRDFFPFLDFFLVLSFLSLV